MIIEQITLSNWLSYPAKWEQDGQLVEPCLRFDQEQVYLIFGKNGAGKSSIMDAILFALYGDYSRASGRKDVKQHNVIRTGEKTATVELIFNLKGQHHKIRRIQNERTSSAQYFSWDITKQKWVPGPSQSKAVNAKITSLLDMNQDLFCGTVILEQGKTGRFMELKPGEQVDHVKNLLGLNIYSLYYDKAKELANQRKRDVHKIEEDLKKLADTTVETVENAENEKRRLQNQLDQLEKEIERLDRLYTQSQTVEGLRKQIVDVLRRISEYETWLGQKDKIKKAAQIVQGWGQVEAQLREVAQAQKQQADQQTRVNDLQTELDKKQQELLDNQKAVDDKLKPDYEQAEGTLKEAKESLETARKQLAEAKEQRDLIDTELELDRQQNKTQSQQEDRQQRLKHLPDVEAYYHLWTELNRVMPKLDAIVSNLHNCQETTVSVTTSEQSLLEEFNALEKRRSDLDQLKEQSKALDADLVAAQEVEEKIRSELKTDEALLEKREEAHGQSKCPTCGTSLEGKELARFHQELMELREKVESGKSASNEARQNRINLKEKVHALDKQCRQEERAVEREDSRLTTEQKNLKSRKTRAESQEQEAHKQWEMLKGSLSYSAQLINAPTTECLHLAREQLEAISNIQKSYHDLTRTQADFKAAREEFKRIQDKRQYPAGTFSETQLSDANNAVAGLAAAVKEGEGKLEKAEREERKLYKLFIKTESDIGTLRERIQEIEQRLLRQEQKHLTESERHKQDTLNRLEDFLSTLDWSTQHLNTLRQAANGNQQADQTIRAWVQEHRPLAAQMPELKKAEKEIGDLHSRHAILDEQIKTFPDEVQQAQSALVEKQLQTRKTEKDDYKTEYERWQKKAWEETERLTRKQDLQEDFECLIVEEENFRDLAALLEPPGPRSAGGPLLREIMREALQKVAKRASDILEEWNQTTMIIIPKDSLEFKVTDRAIIPQDQASDDEHLYRHYQLFSGGEKFMVALAMALAIGEVASDTGHTDCLFIDEGFGLLDKDNRAFVAQEIVNNLVRSGQRKQIVVITHMEDIQEAFPDKRSRYHLINDGNATRLSVGEDDAGT